MSLTLYNTRTRTLEEFAPQQPPRVRMYVCGPTVYDEPHIGHARSAYVFDVIRRWLTYRGYDVQFVRNVTDVDDKIIEKARQEHASADVVAAKYLQSYHEALALLGIQEPTAEPRATAHIDEMVNLIAQLIVKGVAYDAKGSVYFAVEKFPAYGRLSNRSTEEMLSGTRGEPEEGKRHPLDFALWKAAKPGEPSWKAPWGAGRPGWHIECSAMSTHCLGGPQIDIHGGGLDLLFPHHENEIAQSEAASGASPFAKYWLHHGLLTINGQKMSKSLGNFVTAAACLQRSSSDALKWFFLKAHYRSSIDFTWERLTEAREALEHLYAVIDRPMADALGASEEPAVQERIAVFEQGMDDDCNTPQALSVLFDLAALARTSSSATTAACAAAIRRLGQEVFGLFTDVRISVHDDIRVGENAQIDLSEQEIERLKQERNEARHQGDYRKADDIRATLLKAGVIIEDTKDGTLWRRKR